MHRLTDKQILALQSRAAGFIYRSQGRDHENLTFMQAWNEYSDRQAVLTILDMIL